VYKIIASCLCAALFSSQVVAEPNTSDVRDPTMPLGHITASASGKAVQQFTLNSILISPQRKLAIINGNTLREGQLIPGSANVKVQRISAQGVVLQHADEIQVLRLSPSIIKRH
jgi:MSHA biogenesis protein MshK